MAIKFNIARLTHSPSVMELEVAFAEFGDNPKFVVREIDKQGNTIYAKLVIDRDVTIQQLDHDKKAMDSTTVTRSKEYPFSIQPREDGSAVFKTYAGSASIFKDFEVFF